MASPGKGMKQQLKAPESSGLDQRFLTPVFRQYERIKRQYADCIVLFRLGDFYECFGEDAKVVSEVLGLVLTSREAKKGHRVPMCGIPYHALDRYLPKLLEHGFRVAICEQTEDPKQAKGLVRREVVRVVTKGTVVEENMLDERANNYLAAIAKVGESIGLSWADLSTGEFYCEQFDPPRAEEGLLDELTRLMPAELLWPKEWENPSLRKRVSELCGVIGDLDLAPGELLDPKAELCDHFGVKDLSGFGCENLPAAQAAAARVLHYLKRTQMGRVSHIRSLKTKFPGEHMILDQTTLRNLEVVRSMRGDGRYGTLLWALDGTRTPMGSRLLQKWLCMPLLDIKRIEERLDAVEELYHDPMMRGEVREALRGMPDLERLMGRVGTGSAHARHLAMIREALGRVPRIAAALEGAQSKKLREIRGRLGQGREVFDLLRRAISDDPPAGVREQGIIREGYSQELDELRRKAKEAKEWIASLEERERRRTGIKSLKVGYNQVIGYYIEVTKPNLHLVPPD
ncbi:MAG TPA: DNA mismatch repair protein MutS, partial [Armatimonadetes bacterium]|nr:DNA mismatch repair protein MutS [Armatimonadota bacterium]